MAAQQIRPWDVIDQRVLDVMQQIPREHFVPREYRGLAFGDFEIPLGPGRFMLPPRMEGRLLQALQLRPVDQILEIGTGAGFLTACLARLGGHVLSFDPDAGLSSTAAERLNLAGVTNVSLRVGDALSTELPSAGFDAIAVTAALPELPAELETLLKPGGRLFVVVGKPPLMQAILVTKVRDGVLRREALFETELPLLPGTSAASFRF